MIRKFLHRKGNALISLAVLFAVFSFMVLPLSAAVSGEERMLAFFEQKKSLSVLQTEDREEFLLPLESDPVEISKTAPGSLVTVLFGESIVKDAELLPPVLEEEQEEVKLFACPYTPTPEEYEMLLYCIDHETVSGSLRHRILIAQVIFNRVLGPKFGSTVKEILTKKGQFSVMTRWENREGWIPKEDTIKAVDYVLSGCSPDIADGAVYFCNPYIVGEGNWFDTTLQVVCELEGHRFYKPY